MATCTIAELARAVGLVVEILGAEERPGLQHRPDRSHAHRPHPECDVARPGFVPAAR